MRKNSTYKILVLRRKINFMEKTVLTGKPSIDRPWMKFYPPQMIANLQVPRCTLREYLEKNMPGLDVVALHYYGDDITWRTFWENTDAVARSLRAIGFGEGDQIPVFLRSVPEFLYLLLAAEKIGAALLCRDNTLAENVEAVMRSGAKAMIAHDFLSKEEMDAYVSQGKVEKIVLLDPCHSCDYNSLRENIQNTLDSLYPEERASGEYTMDWDEFLALGKNYTGVVEAEVNYDRPLFCAYTSGSTGPSKQVIHSSNTMIGIVHQMNFYGASDAFRPTWLVTALPPCLIAVVVAMLILPLASNKLLILDPFCDVQDVDIELMHYRPNCWPLIPMFMEIVMNSKRVPDDYDMSHLFSAGAGSEASNNKQLRRAQQYLIDHNCKATYTTGYGCSEAGSSVSLPMSPEPIRNGNVGIPMPLTTISIFKPGTHEELGYNQIGEICKTGPGNMLGYDNPEATAKALQLHEDGNVWLHLGDLGYMTENGVIYTLTRGESPRFGGGELCSLPMENLIADAEIKGIRDEFFVIIPDDEHPGYFLPYLYVVLEEGYTVDDIRDAVNATLEPHMLPVDILPISERPFFHFKTNRIGLSRELIAARAAKKNQ